MFVILAGLLILALVVLQFFRPEENAGVRDTSSDVMNSSHIPDTVAMILQASCYDCHSNNTIYPWYGKISPVSWYMHNHIREGREHLNFSEWTDYSKPEKIGKLDDLCEEVTSGSMPLRSYLLLHGDARLSAEQVIAICDWTESESMQILRGE